MATKLADWVTQSVEGAIKTGGIHKWQGVLNTEWGGMNEALFNLYAITQGTAAKAHGAIYPVPLRALDSMLRLTRLVA